ncbi:glycosyltransferase 87 family protein [Streptomyces clavuligerus]|uniref:glycosyltransferase 87 family protein n=1 Tax=Streptomyces clavuligerus TaxID=1901 RepID=UPI0018D05787|nr:glycosyltransferase 87 family protein [Streptomyces clavuligerus]
MRGVLGSTGLTVWILSRAVLLACVFGVVDFPGPDVTADVSVIYRGWYETLRSGSFPVGDVTWQYPPGAGPVLLAPAVLPFLDYAAAFFVLVFLCDGVVQALLGYAGRRPGGSVRGVWVWVVGVPLLGPTAYARYDLMVTAVAVAALVLGAGRPGVLGALAGLGALLKVWPLLLLTGVERGRATRLALGAAAAVAAGVALPLLALPGGWAFLTAQRDRGTEIESLGGLVFHGARYLGWDGRVLLHYGSVEFLGPGVPLVSALALGLAGAALGWLLLWRRRARAWPVEDAAFAAVLLFTTTSRVISPQYMLWLVGLAAMCLCAGASRMGRAAGLVLVATGVTVLEFPVFFAEVTASTPWGVGLLFLRNGLLVAATLYAAGALRRAGAESRAPRTAVGRA